MLSHSHFYWNMTRKYIIAFNHIFSDIHVLRENSAGEVEKDILVKTTYAGKRKFANMLQRTNKQVSVVLPRISFLITGFTPDNTRRLNNSNTISTDSGEFFYSPEPYDFNVDLVIWAKNMDDILQIVEQSVVFFKPQYTIKVKEIPSLNIERNITISLNSVDFDNDLEYDEETDRTLMANMNFTLKGFLYPPISDSNIIDIINVQFRDQNNENPLSNINHVWNVLTSEIDTVKTIEPNAEWSDND